MKKTVSIIEDLHRQALEALEVASDALIDDTEEDDRCPLLVMEAAYRIAVFSRAARAIEPSLIKPLRFMLNDTLKLMSGGGIRRLCEAAQHYFSHDTIRRQAEPLHESVTTSIEKGELDVLIENEEFEQAVFDLLLQFDRFYALCHPKDAPLRELRKALKAHMRAIAGEYERCKGLFTLYAEQIRRYAHATRVPQEKHYGLWTPVPIPSEKKIITAIGYALSASHAESAIFEALIKPLPCSLKRRIRDAGIADRFGQLIAKLELYARELRDMLSALGAVVHEPISEGVYAQSAQESSASYALIRSRYYESLRSLPALINENPRLSSREKQDLLFVAYLLLNDRQKLSSLIKKYPQRQ